MVYTSVTIEGVSHEMWLPVLDGANKAMKAVPYTYTCLLYTSCSFFKRWESTRLLSEDTHDTL